MLPQLTAKTDETTTRLPWRRPRREGLVLALVAVAALSPLYPVSSQDSSRLCLTRALAAGRLTVAPCIAHSIDRARFGGRTYSDKAPGMSLLAAPAVAATGLPDAAHWHYRHDFRLWLVRVATSGVAFLLLVFALGRVAEGLAPGSGEAVSVTLALGTLTGALAATTFDQVTAAACAFGTFVLAWRRRPGYAGLVAGLGLLVEYEVGIFLAIVGLYVAAQGRRPLARFGLGALPGAAVLAVYDRAAFGSPFHLSYRYVANGYARAQSSGFFGISWPHLHSISIVLLGDRGILIASPVLVAAAWGLALLARRRRAEALVCAAAAAAGLLLEFGYFLPYGGVSPGPRFLIPALPFLCLGAAESFRRAPRVTAALAVTSVVASTTVLLTWSNMVRLRYRGTIWGELARALDHRHSRVRATLASNVLHWAGFGPTASAIAVALVVAAAVLIALPLRPRRPLERPPLGLRADAEA